MNPQVASRVAQSLASCPHPVTVVWHGGEPLAVGLSDLGRLCSPFRALREAGRVQHSMQTNATLLTPRWCDFLAAERFQVGVSLDGGFELNGSRVNWAGAPSFDTANTGIALLRQWHIPFNVIAVVNPLNIDRVDEFYRFFVDLGCAELNINVEEREGANRFAQELSPTAVRRFWRELFVAWTANPKLRIREFDRALGWCQGRLAAGPRGPRKTDLWPTVAYDGDVVVLSPELIAAGDEFPSFVVGNVLARSLEEIVESARQAWYVEEFRVGRAECQRSCDYYSYCGGGHASNKLFELGTLRGTETAHCRNSRQAVLDAVLDALSTVDNRGASA
jgi:uncharacterized protein